MIARLIACVTLLASVVLLYLLIQGGEPDADLVTGVFVAVWAGGGLSAGVVLSR